MTRVDFYILPEQTQEARFGFACKLIEKAYRRGHKIIVHADEAEAFEIDELLWTYKAESFLPHNIVGEGPNVPPPIQITFNEQPGRHHDLLINLANNVPGMFNRFNRVIEIVDQDETRKNLSRENYKFYKSHGCQLHSHDMTK